MRLPEYFLEEGTYYVVEVTVEIPGRTLGLSAHSFYTNIRPYNGSCDVNPLIGMLLSASTALNYVPLWHCWLTDLRQTHQDFVAVMDLFCNLAFSGSSSGKVEMYRG